MPEEKTRDEIEHSEAPSEEVLEPTMGKGLPSYRPWDWIAGYGVGIVIIIAMFAFADSMYDMAP